MKLKPPPLPNLELNPDLIERIRRCIFDTENDLRNGPLKPQNEEARACFYRRKEALVRLAKQVLRQNGIPEKEEVYERQDH
jgi:hypothetical protein